MVRDNGFFATIGEIQVDIQEDEKVSFMIGNDGRVYEVRGKGTVFANSVGSMLALKLKESDE
ncbi:unnamed protein product, partial [Rotaria sp. Silwood2]